MQLVCFRALMLLCMHEHKLIRNLILTPYNLVYVLLHLALGKSVTRVTPRVTLSYTVPVTCHTVPVTGAVYTGTGSNRGFGFVTAVSIYRGILLIPYRKTAGTIDSEYQTNMSILCTIP